MTGRTAEELIGKSHWEEFPGASGTAAGDQFSSRHGGARGRSHSRTTTRRCADGSTSGHIPRATAAIGYFQDITERKHAEDALRGLNETLEVQVAQRTAELQAKEARLRTIFETSYTYQGLLALDGTLLDANATSLAGIGATLEDVVGKPFGRRPGSAARLECPRRCVARSPSSQAAKPCAKRFT